MKNYTLYLIRHGITRANLEGLYAGGGTDLPLCDEGRAQLRQPRHVRLKLRKSIHITSICNSAPDVPSGVSPEDSGLPAYNRSSLGRPNCTVY